MERPHPRLNHPKRTSSLRSLLALVMILVNLLPTAPLAMAQADTAAPAAKVFLPVMAASPQTVTAQPTVADQQTATDQQLVLAAAATLVVDDAGADDEPGQKDLNFLTIDYAPSTPDIAVTWGWDDTQWSGANTGDACTLFDTDSDGNANYSLCITVNQDGSYNSTRLYSCDADSRADRCAGPTQITTFSSTGSASIQAIDPFGTAGRANNDCSSAVAGTCLTQDTVAALTVKLSDFGGATAKLLNVCSYPSQEPNSDPSDCVITPNAGFLTLVKVANPNDGTAFTFNASAPSANGTSSWTINGSGSVELISYPATTALDLSEAVPAGWQLDSASCAIQTSSPTPTGAGTATGIDNLEIRSGLETICTFTNSLAQGTLTLVKVVDNLGGSGLGVSSFPLTIDGNATTSGTAVTVSAGDHTIAETSQPGYTVGAWSCSDGTSGSAGSVSATVNVSGGENVTCTITNTLIAAPALTISKVATEQSYDAVGDVINYTIVATNAGNVTIPSVTVSDPLVSDLTCTPVNGSSLAPGATMTCTATHTITQADLDAGSYANVACVDDGAAGAAQACADEEVPVDPKPALTITKVATEQSYDAVGDVINYTIVATNSGNTTLASVTVSDPQVSNLVCTPVNGSSLAPGASMSCTATHTITQADLDAGSYANVACVDDGAAGAALVCADEEVPVDPKPALTITKVATEQSYDAVGDVVNYTIVATNSGNTTLAAVTVTDAQVSNLVCTPVNGSSLAPGASMSCTATHTITQADIDAGSYANVACVDDGAAGAAQTCADEEVPVDPKPALTITKVATEQSYDAVGDVINYTILATNSGNTTLASVTVSDPLVSDLTCTPVNGSSLAPGASMSCTATHTVTQADIDAGSYANVACVDDGAAGAAQACADEEVPAVKNPALTITKVATEQSYDAVGDVINYTIVATNSGNTTLAAVTVTDAQVSNLVCTPVNGSSLAPSANMSCTATHTVTQADIDAGSYANVACVDDGAAGAAQACADEEVPAVKNPALTISKVATEQSYDAVGDVINYTIVATNSGNTTLANVTVSDPQVSDLVCTPVNGSSLAPGASMTCTASHTVTQADIDAGSYANIACVDDGAAGAAQVCADEEMPAVKNPALTITKVATEQSYDAVGDVINYTIVATNSGNTTLAAVTVTDPLVSDLTCTPVNGSSLAPGASMSCTATHIVTQADIDAGSYANVACVDDGAAGATQACADEEVPENALPDVTVIKTGSPTAVPETGGNVTFTYQVTNNSDEAAEITALSDDKFGTLVGDADCKVGTILAGKASCTFSATFAIPAGDFPGSHVNVFTGTVKDDDGNEDTDTDNETVTYTNRAPTVNIVKTVDANADGTFNDSEPLLNADGTATYKYQVTNTSPAAGFDPLTIDTLVDDRGTATTSDDKTLVSGGAVQSGVTLVKTGGDQDNLLEVGETWTYTWKAVVPVNATTPTNTNIATVTARDDDGTSATDDDTASVRLVDYGQIAPTGVTCGQYVNGTAPDFSTFYAAQGGVIQYQVKSNKISATNPGVFFYWTGLSKTITGAGPVFIDQSDNNANIGPFAPVPNDIKLWLVTGTTCTQVQLAASQYTISNGDVTVNIPNAAPAGSYYVISVKYDTGSVVGQNAIGKPTVKFNFTTDVGNNGSIEETDTKGITLKAK